MQYNLYLYCNDNPVNNTDPSGHFAFSALAVAGLIAVGAVVGGAVGAYTSAASDSNIKIGIIEGALLGGAGTACALLVPEAIEVIVSYMARVGLATAAIPVIKSLAVPLTVGVASAAGGGIDYGFQLYGQKDEDLKVIDKSRIIKTGIESGICAAIPAITGSYFAAFGTGLVWGDTEEDWMNCRVENGKYIGVGDKSKLSDIIRIFKEWNDENIRLFF